MNLFGFVPYYTRYIYHAGKEPLFVLLLAFLITFAITRGYTRIARRRGWGSGSIGGVHLHHSVPGMIIVLLSGLLAFTRYADDDAVWTTLAIFFGAGAALVLDEFALIFHLKDVYWSNEGRSSIDATVMGVLVTGLLLTTASPFQVDTDADAGDPRGVAFIVIAANLGFAALTFMKGKFFLGILAIFIPVFGWIGSIRLAKPYSPWAHHRYEPDRARTEHARKRRAHKLERAWDRYEHGRVGRLETWFIDLIGGKPHLRPEDDESEPLPARAPAGIGSTE